MILIVFVVVVFVRVVWFVDFKFSCCCIFTVVGVIIKISVLC